MELTNKPYHSDLELINRVLQGDERAFLIIIRQTEGLVAQMVYRMAGTTADRKDLAQEIYMKVYQNLSTFGFRSKLSTWIGQIAYHTCLQYLNKRKLSYLEDIPADDKVADHEIAGNETLLFQKDLSGILQSAIERLPPFYQTLITLFHTEELSYEEIMDITGLPEGTVKNYLFRARKALRKDLLRRYHKDDL